MKTWTNLRPLTLLAAMLATLTLVNPASALQLTPAEQERSLLREAQGRYQLDDGRTLTVKMSDDSLRVSFDAQRTESWHAANTDLLVSPDGLRRLRLIRNTDGSVDRIELEVDRLR